MGLDAGVYCDCFERGRLKCPPPAGCSLSVDVSGMLLCGSDDLEVQIAFDDWLEHRACEHEHGWFIQHHLGNIGQIARLRHALELAPKRFPLLLEKVIWSGSHCGDFVPAEEVHLLRPELRSLARFKCEDPDVAEDLKLFRMQMNELIRVAIKLGRPIAF